MRSKKYLIISSIFTLVAIIGIVKYRKMYASLTKSESERLKFKGYYSLLVDWSRKKLLGKDIESYLSRRDIRTVAIYGMKEMGELLYHDLNRGNIKIKYAIDQSGDGTDVEDLRIYYPDEYLEPVDAIIVTPIHCFNDIKRNMEKKVNYPVISLKEIIDQC